MILRNKIFFALLFIVTCFVNYNAYAITNCNGYSYSQCAEKTGCEWSGNSVTGRCVNSIGQVDLDVCELLTHSECNNNNCCIWISLQAAVDDYEDGECQLKPNAGSNCGATSPLVTCDTNQYYNSSICVACPSQYPESSGGLQNSITSCYRSCGGTTYYYNDGQTIPCDCLSTQQACQSSNRCIWSGASIGCHGCDVNEYLYIDPVTAEPACHSCATDTDGERPVSPAGSVGIESCTASNCSNGYYYDTTLRNCAPCTQPTGWYAWTSAGDTNDPDSCGFSCTNNYYYDSSNNTCRSCSTQTSGKYPYSHAEKNSANWCYNEACDTTVVAISNGQRKSATCSSCSEPVFDDPDAGYRMYNFYNKTCNEVVDCDAGYGEARNSSTDRKECHACTDGNIDTSSGSSFNWVKTVYRAGSYYNNIYVSPSYTTCPYVITCPANAIFNAKPTYRYAENHGQSGCQLCNSGYESSVGAAYTVSYDKDSTGLETYTYKTQDNTTIYTISFYGNTGGVSSTTGTQPTCVNGIYTITLNTNKPSGSGISISNEGSRTKKIYQHYDTNWLNSADPSDVLSGTITVPRISGIDKEFNGYWTDPNNGEQIIDANGTVLKQNTYFTDDATLYAHWSNGVTYKLNISYNDALTEISGCRTDSACSMSAFQNTCGTNVLDLTSLNNSITTNQGDITNSSGAFSFTPNSTGITTITNNTPHELTLTIGSDKMNQCSIDSTCARCIKTECRFHLASNNYQTCAKTYFTNKTEFKDKTNQTYKLQIGDTDKARISSYAASKIPNN